MNAAIETFADFKRRYPIRPADPANWLGSGSYGRVVKVEDQVETEWVAVKISEYKGQDTQSLRAEVELAQRIPRHANIARYDSCYRFETDASVSDFAVMKYYQDGNLAKLLKREPLTTQQVYDLTRGILLGLQHLHRHRVVHRDFKPANILISRDNGGRLVPKIADFGLSKWVKSEGSADRSDFDLSDGRGTPSYKAPEQIEGGRVSYNLDLWAFGVVLYEMLLGERPFEANTATDSEQARRRLVERKIIDARLPAAVEQVAEPYQTIIRRCLVRDLHQRVRRADELLDLLSQHPATQQPVSGDRVPVFAGEEPTDVFGQTELTDVFGQTEVTELLTNVTGKTPPDDSAAPPRAVPVANARAQEAVTSWRTRRKAWLWTTPVVVMVAGGCLYGWNTLRQHPPKPAPVSHEMVSGSGAATTAAPINLLTAIASTTQTATAQSTATHPPLDQLLQQTRTAFYRAQYPQALLLAEKGLTQEPQRLEFIRLKSLAIARLTTPVAAPGSARPSALSAAPTQPKETARPEGIAAGPQVQRQYDQLIERGNNAIDHGNNKEEAISLYTEAHLLADKNTVDIGRGHERYLFYLKKGDRIFERDGREGAQSWYRVAQAIENTSEVTTKIKKCAQLQ